MMRLFIAVLCAVLLMGCGMSEQEIRTENRHSFELLHNMNIIRVRHFDEDTKQLTVTFTYYSPAYFWYESKKDSSIKFFWEVRDIRDSVWFFPPEMTDFKRFNRIDDPTDYKMVIQEAIEYYQRGIPK